MGCCHGGEGVNVGVNVIVAGVHIVLRGFSGEGSEQEGRWRVRRCELG